MGAQAFTCYVLPVAGAAESARHLVEWLDVSACCYLCFVRGGVAREPCCTQLCVRLLCTYYAAPSTNICCSLALCVRTNVFWVEKLSYVFGCRCILGFPVMGIWQVSLQLWLPPIATCMEVRLSHTDKRSIGKRDDKPCHACSTSRG